MNTIPEKVAEIKAEIAQLQAEEAVLEQSEQPTDDALDAEAEKAREQSEGS